MKNLLDVIKIEGKETPGRVVRAFRKSFGITLKELETVTGIPQSNLSAIENDRLDIGLRRALLLAAAFGIEPQHILFPAGYERPEAKEMKQVKVRIGKVIAAKRRAAG